MKILTNIYLPCYLYLLTQQWEHQQIYKDWQKQSTKDIYQTHQLLLLKLLIDAY